jgi:hypothetical protein
MMCNFDQNTTQLHREPASIDGPFSTSSLGFLSQFEPLACAKIDTGIVSQVPSSADSFVIDVSGSTCESVGGLDDCLVMRSLEGHPVSEFSLRHPVCQCRSNRHIRA